MPPCKAMYTNMFRQVSKTIKELQTVQQKCEEIYMDNVPEPLIKLAGTANRDEDKDD